MTPTRCRARTAKGKPCPIGPTPTGLCHVHEPSLQCGGIKRGGGRCNIPTGGVPCPAHQGQTWQLKLPKTLTQPQVDPKILWVAGLLADEGQFS